MAAKNLSGGEALQRKLAALAKKVAKPGLLRVGFLEGGTEPNGASTPLVAFLQEFGAPRAGIPPRPFFRTMITAKSPEWGEQLGALLKVKDYDTKAALELMGIAIEDELRDSIVALTEPALSKVTLMLRKMRSEDQSLVVTGKVVGEAAARVAAGESVGDVSTKPLEDSKNMLHSISSEVKV